MASKRLAMAVVAAILFAAPAAAAGRGLKGLPYDPTKPLPNIHNQIAAMKAKKAVVPIQPIAVVSNANYVSPALAISNEPRFVAPLAVAAGPSLLQRAQAYFARPAALPVAPLAAPMSAVPVGPIYASGMAMPTPGVIVGAHHYKLYEFPFLKKVATLGINTVKVPDPIQVAPPQPQFVGGKGKGAALVAGPAFAPQAIAPIPGVMVSSPAGTFASSAAAPQQAGVVAAAAGYGQAAQAAATYSQPYGAAQTTTTAVQPAVQMMQG